MAILIDAVKAREIFDSRGNPTVEAEVQLSNGIIGRAEVPSGASTGEKEAVELRDGGSRLQGKGVLKAVATHQPLYRYLGGTDLELPQTFHNVINGGEHADNGIDIQEFMITPVERTSFREGFEKITNTYHTLKKVIEEAGYTTGLGDEGGFAPNLKNSEDALQMLHDAIIQAGYTPGKEIAVAFDAAASYFYNRATKNYDFEGKTYTPSELGTYYIDLLNKFPEIISIEDPYGEEDWNNFAKFTDKYGERIQIVADDPVCTNPALIRDAISQGMANSILIKLNQIGTITETLEAIRLARKNGYTTMMSHRSGETGDTFISDFTVATNAAELKAGAPARSERVEKYNQLLRIEEEIGVSDARLAHFPDDVKYD
ncbi:enolase [Pediococcus pentosaceus]|uniref:phosphopyruvate hydratase n=1 Tax=Pediococcus pentosaceus TaxID=1255 RepID=UPI001F314E44|nr:phosphopyruvate hydratase [Pediococcus pentosaceus]MCE5961189.1 enolase [Pediococcus pentosaceus]